MRTADLRERATGPGAVAERVTGRAEAHLPAPPRDDHLHHASTGKSEGARGPAPWGNSWFWILQFLILAASLVRLAVSVRLGISASTPALEYSTVFLFLPLAAAAALAFGVRGAAVSCAWTLVLAAPRLVDAASGHAGSVAVAECLQLALVTGVAVAAGIVVDGDRRRRRRAERAVADAGQAMAVYRELFDSNASPILVIDSDGTVADANAAALEGFRVPGAGDLAPTAASREGNASGRAHRGRPRLVDVVGAGAAAAILARLLALAGNAGEEGRSRMSPAAEASTVDSSGELGPVEVPFRGRPVLFRPAVSVVSDGPGVARLQVVFQDVTEERRRRDLLESFAARVVSAQEEERRRIAQELHDGPLQSLIHLCRQVDTLPAGRQGAAGGPELRATVEGLVGEIRAIAKGLRPSTLDDLGLVASLEQLLLEVERRGQLRTSLGVTGSERRLPAAVELALFRIAQEALSNVERHSAAQAVAVGLDFEGGGIRLLVKDDGIGFDVAGHREAAQTAGSLGIAGMAERANLIGAHLRVRSRPGAGTSIDVQVPRAVSVDQKPF